MKTVTDIPTTSVFNCNNYSAVSSAPSCLLISILGLAKDEEIAQEECFATFEFGAISQTT